MASLSVNFPFPTNTHEKGGEGKGENKCIEWGKKRLKPSSGFHSAVGQGSSIYLPRIMYTLEEVKSIASLLQIGRAMTILQSKRFLLIYSIWYFLSILYDVVYYLQCCIWCCNKKDTDLTVWLSILIWVHSTRSWRDEREQFSLHAFLASMASSAPRSKHRPCFI